MEIKLTGKDAVVVLGATLVNVVIAGTALKKAHIFKKEAEHQKFMREAYEADNCIKDIMIKRLKNENDELKSAFLKES